MGNDDKKVPGFEFVIVAFIAIVVLGSIFLFNHILNLLAPALDRLHW